MPESRPPLRVALAATNPIVGDLGGNAAGIVAMVEAAGQAGAALVVLPEMALTGYPVEDLVLRPGFRRAAIAAADQLSADLAAIGLADVTAIVGGLGEDRHGRATNTAWVLRGGRVTARYDKHHLPNYGVFDEFRYFAPGVEPLVVDVAGYRIGVAICEDLWQEGGPVSALAGRDVDLLAVLNGSPFEAGKQGVRLEHARRRAAEVGAALAYVNLVGGQDELVFDGGSFLIDRLGRRHCQAARFLVELSVCEIDDSGPLTTTGELDADGPEEAEVYAALVLGLRDYVEKNGMASVILGLSGGIDSALVAALAVDALGPDRVHGVSLPSRYSSEHSRADAADLARRTGLRLRTIPIEPMVEACHAALAGCQDAGGVVPVELAGLAAENLQARVRGITLMALSNAEGHLVLATGNKSELATGYSTIYGDAVGGFAPIKDVPKTLVWRLARWRNGQAELAGEVPPIPEASIDKEPSAELRPDQRDRDSLPDYALLDEILDRYVERNDGAAALVATGYPPAVVSRVLALVDAAEFKRRQYPPGTKISLRAFGRDRRLPLTSRWREPVDSARP